jgi:hypothetical protein
MASLNVQRAVSKISEKVKKGEKVVYGQIMKEVGYSNSVCKHPQKLHTTKTYRRLMKPLLERLQDQIDSIVDAMNGKDKTQEDFRVLAYSLDVLVKNQQLLSGGATERKVFVLPSEVLNKNKIEFSTGE